MSIQIRPELPQDREAIRRVNALAFGRTAEAELIDALREGGHVAVSLVAEVEGSVVGHILMSSVAIESPSRRIQALSLAPLAVLPECQRRGVGTALVEAALDAGRQLGARIVVVLGHPGLYSRFGFRPELAQQLSSPFGGGESWMALELLPGSLAGVEGTVEYPPPFQTLA